MLSGTSLDGIDVAAVDVRERSREIMSFDTVPFRSQLRDRILAAYPPASLDALTYAALHADVGAAFGDAVAAVAGSNKPLLVGSHGITLAHAGDAAQTLAVGDAFAIRERTSAAVAYDFRAADCAAGGHGAPLVPYLDTLVFGGSGDDRVALNLGGIANITILRAGASPSDVLAFDVGPANVLLDTYVALHTLGNRRYDVDGALAALGTVDRALLAQWLSDPYFAAAPPKSTGRERFGLPFISRYRERLDRLGPHDAMATLAALTVSTIAAALERWAPPRAEVIVSGGGVHNRTLMAALSDAQPRRAFRSSSAYGIDPDAKEALLFAVLAYELVRGRPANLPQVTGARGPRLLGALAPYDPPRLAAALRAEDVR